MEFKVGDRVKCLGKHHSNSPDLNPIAGTKGVVIGVDNSDRQLPVRVNWDNGVLTWAFGDDVVSVLPAHKIVITTDGVTTLARLYDGEKIVKSAEAKCSPSDTFNFNTGAHLAYNRLMYGTDYHPSEFAFKPEQPKREYKVGDKVKFISDRKHREVPRFYPPVGTVGTVTSLRHEGAWVQWENGSTSKNDKWYSDAAWFEPYTEPPKPKYYSGKVVCVEAKPNYYIYTTGKVYTITDGDFISDKGSNPFCSKVESIDHLNNELTKSKFIEYKGEA